jgi:thioredoxin-dependent peroxiredoxin
VVLGISPDQPAALKKFEEKYELPFTLLSDPDKKVAGAFDVVKEKNMYGKKVMGIERTTFLIDPQGRVAHVFAKVKAEGHAEEVLAELKK